MGYEVDPIEAAKSLRHGVSNTRTICEVWREIYDKTSGLGIDRLILEGFIMGKGMHKKLVELSGQPEPMGWGPNPHFDKSTKLRKGRMTDYWDKEWTRRIQDDVSVKMNTRKAEMIIRRLWDMPELIKMNKLEVGCGPALHIARLASRCKEWAENYIGIDPSAVAMETAQKHVRAYQLSVFDLPVSPISAKTVQAVFLFDVIEHIEDHDRLADSIKTVTADQFCVLINVPLYRSKLEENGGFERPVDIQDVKRFLQRMGIDSLSCEVYGIGGYPYLWAQGGTG